jgi:hypothetical protein
VSIHSKKRHKYFFLSGVHEITYEGITLPGYFYKVDDKSVSPRPTLILFTGFDGIQEELYPTSVVAALDRGYNCLTFEGPGQGSVIRKQKLLFVTIGRR